jgi:ferritin-like metal-binding protein YciE
MAFETLQDVLVDQLKDLLSAEKQLVKALPKMAKAATDERLREALEEHAEVTRQQAERLTKVFESMDMTAKAKKCEGMAGLILEGEEVLEHKKSSAGPALDAAIIIACQKVEHYEISTYGSVRTLAEELGLTEAAELLQETLDEESEANEKLNEIAQEVNAAAAEGADESEEEEDDDDETVASANGRGAGARGRGRATSGRSR